MEKRKTEKNVSKWNIVFNVSLILSGELIWANEFKMEIRADFVEFIAYKNVRNVSYEFHIFLTHFSIISRKIYCIPFLNFSNKFFS